MSASFSFHPDLDASPGVGGVLRKLYLLGEMSKKSAKSNCS